ncbi:MAG TPA: CsgG/HfaB family protein [Vicinamibacteria bacterium]|nr:CsgG/HfaB family protein [Vicinamibacteria bacterium]
MKLFTGLAAAVCVLGLAGMASAQTARSKKPLVAVTDFDFGTVGYHWWGNYDIGKGMADQVMSELLEDGTFRVVERKKLDTILAEQDFAHSDRADPGAAKLSKLGKVLGVRYIITGSITKFGGEDKGKGGSLHGIHVGVGKAKTEVSLTARLVDTTTGEVLLAAKGEGVSKKGGGFSFGKSGVGSYGQETTDFKASAIGEAQEAACKDLVAKIVAKKDRLED